MVTRNFPFADIAALTSGNRGPAHTADVSARSDTATEISRLSGFTTISLLHRDVATEFTRPMVEFEKILVQNALSARLVVSVSLVRFRLRLPGAGQT